MTGNGEAVITDIARDAGGREVTRSVSGGVVGDTQVGTVSTIYDLVTGQVSSIWDRATNLVHASSYDSWARLAAFTDQATADAGGLPESGTGASTTTGYDAAGRVRVTDDGVIRAEYSYDQPGDYRALVSQVTYTRARGGRLYSASASYDPDGQPDDAPIAPGLRFTEASDAAGNTTTRRYGTDAGSRLAAWSSLPNTGGQIRELRRTATQGATSGRAVTGRRQIFDYDHADRLIRGDDQATSPDGTSACTVRAYMYRPDGARTGSTSGSAGSMPGTVAAAQCAGTVTLNTSRTHTVNAWAQITTSTSTGGGGSSGSGAYAYDPLERVTVLPAVDSPAGTPADTALGYYADGLPRSTTVGAATRTWARDPAGRLAAWTDTTPGQPDTGAVHHYDDPASDSPAWTRNSGGTTNPYTHPQDPINMTDLDGQFAWRGVFQVVVFAAAVAGAVACGASLVCALAVGAAAGATRYAVARGGTSSFTLTGLATSAAVGGVTGGASRFGLGAVAKSASARRPFSLGGASKYRLHFDRQPHPFGPRVGGRSHWQLERYTPGVRRIGKSWAMRVLRSF